MKILFIILWLIFTIAIMWIEPKTKIKKTLLMLCFVLAIMCAIIGF